MKPNPLAEPRLSMAYAHSDQSDDISYDEELGKLFPPENPIETKISNNKKLTKKVTKVQDPHIKDSPSLKKSSHRHSSHSYKSRKMESEKKTEEKTSRKLKRVNTMDLFTESKKSPDKSSKNKTNKKNQSKIIEEKSKKKKHHSGKIKIEKAPSLNSCPDQPTLARI